MKNAAMGTHQRVGGFAITFLLGLVVGITGTVLGPRLLEPYLPAAIRGDLEGIEGAVTSKQRKGDRLLLTVQTAEGVILATFRKKLTEIDLLVAEGDMLTLARTGYRAFMADPAIGRVRKQNHGQPERLEKPLLSDTTDKIIKGQVLQ